jgi:O-antigen/teichoic acid export membrane protein
MSLRNQAARGLKWQAIEIGGRQAFSLVVFTILARLLDPSAFGLAGGVGVYLAFVALFVDQGIGTAIIQRKVIDPEHLNAAFWFNIGCAGLMCGLTVAFARFTANLFHEPKLEALLTWASFSLVINSTATVHHTLYLRAMNFRSPATRTLVANFAGGTVGVAMAFAGCGVWSLIGQQLTASSAGAAFLWTASPWRPNLRFSLTRLRELMAISVSVFSVAFLWFISSRLDQLVVGRFLGAGVLGQYVIGSKIPDLARMTVQQPLSGVLMPALVRMQDNYARMQTALYRGMEFNALVSFAAFGGLAAVSVDLVPALFGPQWRAAGPICALLSLYSLVNALQVFFHPTLIASGGPGGYVVLNLMHAFGVAVACTLGIRFGTSALLTGLIVNAILIAIPALYFLQHRIGLSPALYCRPCLVPLAAALAMGAMVYVVRTFLISITPWLLVAVEIAAGAITYLSIAAVFDANTLRNVLDVIRSATGDRQTGQLSGVVAVSAVSGG